VKQTLHPLTLWLGSILLAIGVVVLNDPFVAIATVGAVGLLVYIRRDGSPWEASFALSLRVGALILLIRTLVGILIGVPIPGRTLFSLPILHLPHGCREFELVAPLL